MVQTVEDGTIDDVILVDVETTEGDPSVVVQESKKSDPHAC